MDTTSTTPERTFHPFPRLPSELRRAIYLLATPQRIVHVQERFRPYASYAEAREHFAETIKSGPWRQTLLDTEPTAAESSSASHVQLHPSLLYFSHNWLQVSVFGGSFDEELRLHRLDAGEQPQPILQRGEAPDGRQALEELGRLLLDAYAGDPHGVEEQLWALCRRTQLYSRAPIPALLHACGESRQVLIESGYELAFGSRGTCSRTYTETLRRRTVLPGVTSVDLDELLLRPEEHGGLTWFNFRTDILYIGHTEHDWPEALCAKQPWDISVFLPHDLARVSRLALSQSSNLTAVIGYGADLHRKLVDYLRLFPVLDELLLAEWAVLGAGGRHDDGPTSDEVREHRLRRAGEPWFCLAQRDVDAFSPAVLKVAFGEQGTAVGVAALRMREALEQRDGGSRISDSSSSSSPEYLTAQTRLWQAELAVMAKETPLGGARSGIPRLPGMKHLPACTLVHVGTEDMLEALQREREAVWTALQNGDEPVRSEEHPYLARPIMPPPWDEESGWVLDKIRPPRREQVVWSVQEHGQKKDRVAVETLLE